MITALYAVLLTVIYMVLTVRVITYRRDNRVSYGDGGDTALLKRVRGHANFTETVPLALILLYLLETLTDIALIVHGLGICLVVGRALHATGFCSHPQIVALRV
ncbi:MAG: MAPEG family protein, partial [Pseudomonadota bacterium]